MIVTAVVTSLILLLALSVLYLAAWPNIVSGARVLTPEGEQLTRTARRRARQAAKTAQAKARVVVASAEPAAVTPEQTEQAEQSAVRDDLTQRLVRAMRTRPGTVRAGLPRQARSSVSVETEVSETIVR